MIDQDELDAQLSAFAGKPAPDGLNVHTDEVLRRISGRRPPGLVPQGLTAAAISGAVVVGVWGGALPSAAASAAPVESLQPGLALAPSTLLEGR